MYIDCRRCDMDYIRSEITFVNHVRDRLEAQVHILVTTQRTGAGGREYTLTFIGREAYAGIEDTLKYVSRQSDTDEMIRSGLVQVLKLGLMPYVAKTPLADHISISFTVPTEPTAVEDRWDYWVFRTRVNTFFRGEKSNNFLSLNGSLSANRVTPDLKVNISIFGNYSENNFDVDNQTITSISRSKGFNSYIVFSLGDHWSWGGSTSLRSSTFRNIDLSLSAGPAVEYNWFPYSESTRRQFRFEYGLTYEYFDYEEETIFNKTIERLGKERVAISLELTEQWGSASAGLEGSHFLHDFSKNRLQLFGQLSVRLIEGLSIRFFGSGSSVRDQLSLRKGVATEEEILLRRKELATQYRYFGSVGLSYTFGSIYSNVVNERFGL